MEEIFLQYLVLIRRAFWIAFLHGRAPHRQRSAAPAGLAGALRAAAAAVLGALGQAVGDPMSAGMQVLASPELPRIHAD